MAIIVLLLFFILIYAVSCSLLPEKYLWHLVLIAGCHPGRVLIIGPLTLIFLECACHSLNSCLCKVDLDCVQIHIVLKQVRYLGQDSFLQLFFALHLIHGHKLYNVSHSRHTLRA